MNKKCSLERKVITAAGWLTGGFYYLHGPEEFRKAKDNKSIDERWGHSVWKFFPGIKNYILFIYLFFWEKKNPKGMHGNFWHSDASSFESFHQPMGYDKKNFFNPSISNPPEHDYTWNFKFSNLSFLYMPIVKCHSTSGKTLAFCQCFRGMGSSEELNFLDN